MRTKTPTQIRAGKTVPVVPVVADAATTGRLISVAEHLAAIASVAEVHPDWTFQDCVDEALVILAEADQPSDVELTAMVESFFPGLHIALTPDLTH